MRVASTCGYRPHVLDDPQCWCGPEVEEFPCDNCGGTHTLRVHKDVMVSRDVQPRMTAFSR